MSFNNKYPLFLSHYEKCSLPYNFGLESWSPGWVSQRAKIEKRCNLEKIVGQTITDCLLDFKKVYVSFFFLFNGILWIAKNKDLIYIAFQNILAKKMFIMFVHFFLFFSTLWLFSEKTWCYDVTDFENGELHSRTANSTDRNTDLSIFQHSKYADYAGKEFSWPKDALQKFLKITKLFFLLVIVSLSLSPWKQWAAAYFFLDIAFLKKNYSNNYF